MVWAEGLERDDAQLLHSMIDELVCTDLHWGMFLPHLASQCDEEQQMERVPVRAHSRWNGCRVHCSPALRVTWSQWSVAA